MSDRSFAANAALAAGAASILTAIPVHAEADVVRVSGQPVHVLKEFSGPDLSSGWDIDGDGIDDANVFGLGLGVGLSGFGMFSSGPGAMFLDRDFRSPPFVLTAPRFEVGDTIGGGAGIYSVENGYLARATYPFTSLKILGGFYFPPELTLGQNCIGFQFRQATGIHYGYADIVIAEVRSEAMLIGASLTVRSWAYEDEPDTAIRVEAVPAPPAAVGALTLLGLGAAGVRSWRRARAA